MPQMWLAGDRRLLQNRVEITPGLVTIKSGDVVGWPLDLHEGAANVGLADGSVFEGNSDSLLISLRNTGTNLNRLAVP
jgi:prepilin-type processing-associated H-X9-DG protein